MTDDASISGQHYSSHVDASPQPELEIGQSSPGAISLKSTKQAHHASLDMLSESSNAQRRGDSEQPASPVSMASGTTPSLWRSKKRSLSSASTISAFDLTSDDERPSAISRSLRSIPSHMQPARHPALSMVSTAGDADGPPGPLLSPTSTFTERHKYGVGQSRLAKPSALIDGHKPVEEPAEKPTEKLTEKPVGRHPGDIKRPTRPPPPPYAPNPYPMPQPGRAERWMQTFGQLNQMGGMAAQMIMGVLQTWMQTLMTAINYAVENSKKRS
ncbi:MAG TPA: hypothetical protein VEN30_22290 [Paraburkholderia sp.]|nr:hypothetical protein [Paraburkholderia sp.]